MQGTLSPMNAAVDLSHLVVLRRELIEQGHTDGSIRTLLARGVLHRVRHGCYVDSGIWASLDEADRHRLLTRAVLRTAHATAVVSHISAALEHGATLWGADLDIVHLTRTDGRSGRREAGVAQHRGKLVDDHVAVVNGIAVTSPARCAMELIAALDPEPALVAVNSLLHDRVLTRQQLFDANRELRHWPSTLASAVVLRLCDERIESVGESRTSYLFHAQGLPRPEPQVEIHDERGHLVGRTDFLLEDEGIFFEFQGKEKYLRFRRPGESLEDFVLREKRRIELTCQVTGYVCFPLTWADLERPVSTAGRIRRLIASRRRLGA
jgi:hypothetical protein